MSRDKLADKLGRIVNSACVTRVAVLVGLVLGSAGAGATHPDRGDGSESPYKIRHREVPPEYRQASIYSIPYTQYSELKFVPVPDGVVVALSSWYRLTFVRELGAWKLAKCEYTEIEGD